MCVTMFVPLTQCECLSVCFSSLVCMSVSLCVSLSVCVSLSECVFVSFSQYAWITLSVSVCLSVCVSLSVCLSLCVSPSHCHITVKTNHILINTASGSDVLLLFNCSFGLTLQSHGLQNARLPCPSPSPGAYSNPCPLSW